MAARRVKDRSSSSFKAARGEFPLGVRGSSAARGLQVGTVSGWRRGDPCQVPAVPVPTVVPFGGHRSHSGRRPRRGVYGRFKASAGRGRRRRPGWLARSRQSAARGPAGAALLPPGASDYQGGGGRGREPSPGGSPAGRRPPGALFRSGAGGVAGGVARSLLAGLRYAARGCTRAAGSGCAWPLSLPLALA